MSVHAGYDPIGSACLGHAQAGTLALQTALTERYSTTSDGIYNCRNIRGGTTKSAHAEGRAVDLHWTDEESGRVIAQRIVDANDALGVQVVIWWDRIWSYTKGWHDYHGADPHHGHLHVEQNWSGANDLTYAAAKAALHAPPTPPTEDDDMPRIYVPTDDNGAPLPGPAYLYAGSAFTPLANEIEEQQLIDAGVTVEHAKPGAWAVLQHLGTIHPR